MTFEIIVPGRFVEPKSPVRMRAMMEGIVTLGAVKNGRVIRMRSFKNLITNVGLDRIGSQSGAGVFQAFSFGTGTTAPSFTDTSLVNRVGGFSASGAGDSTAGVSPDWASIRTISGLSSIGAFGNSNLTEVGIGPQNTLFSRALIVDSNGSPVAFPISEDEQLAASYQTLLYPPLMDQVDEVDVNGLREVTTRALNVGATGTGGWSLGGGSQQNTNFGTGPNTLYTGGLAAITAASPMGSTLNSGTASTLPYENGTYRRVGRNSWSSAQVNSSNIVSQRLTWGMATFQVQYDPPLEKNNEQTMFLDYELAWGRV